MVTLVTKLQLVFTGVGKTAAAAAAAAIVIGQGLRSSPEVHHFDQNTHLQCVGGLRRTVGPARAFKPPTQSKC